jgi:hypothetical protein
LTDPIIFRPAFRKYWKFTQARQDVFYRRFKDPDHPGPWTFDQILKKHKFCNAFRVADRYSQYLVRKLYEPGLSANDKIFRAIVFRIFNLPATFDALDEEFGVRLDTFNEDAWRDFLGARRADGKKLFGGAFMLAATKVFGYDYKHENYVALLASMIDRGPVTDVKMSLIDNIQACPGNLEWPYRELIKFPLIGKFMAYQIAIDIAYSDARVDFDESQFVVAGPGAERGVDKCFESRSGLNYEQVIMWVCERQDELAQDFGVNPDRLRLWGRKLQPIDIQNLFCETDKYLRVAMPELASNRKQIKGVHRRNPEPIDYFFPPRWGINENVRSSS